MKARQTSFAQDATRDWIEGQSPTDFAYRGAEAERVARVKAMGAVPDGTKPGAICDAPARGPVMLYREVMVMLGPDGTTRVVERNHQGFAALRLGDAFDRMQDQARRGWRGEGSCPPLFTPGQVAIARHYAALVERLDAGTVKLSSLEGRVGGSGRGGDVIDARLAQSRELDAMVRRIGLDDELDLRKVRPSKRGSRRVVPARDLVDRVCLGGLTLTEVLRAYGWDKQTRHIAALRMALAAALDRMIGPVYPGRIKTFHAA